jgi:hypothetical protein
MPLNVDLFLQEVLQETTGMFWIDASVRLNSSNLDPAFKVAIQNGGVSLFSATGHSTFAATDPRMWEYLVTDPEMQEKGIEHESGSVLMYRTEKIVKGVLLWHVLCALDKDCIAPKGTKLIRSLQRESWSIPPLRPELAKHAPGELVQFYAV